MSTVVGWAGPALPQRPLPVADPRRVGTSSRDTVRKPTRLRLVGGTADIRTTPAMITEAPPVRLRLTRHGRLAVTLVLFWIVCLAVLWALAARGAPAWSVTVRSGQTLSDLASRELPEVETGEAITRIRLANQLPTTELTAGQRLLIPGSG